MTDFKEVLQNIGYNNIIENAKELRMKPIYRDSSSNTVLSVRKDTGYFIDFSKSISGSFTQLVKLSLGLETYQDAQDWLDNKSYNKKATITKVEPKLREPRVLPINFLTKIEKDDSYWNGRNISSKTLSIFNGGIVNSGKMANRYVFPIFNKREQLIGVSGRCVSENPSPNRPKWKHIGQKSNWVFPAKENYKYLQKRKEVILVESIGDMLSLWENENKNCLVTFGLDIGIKLLNFLIAIDTQKIIISFNNDEQNNSAGNLAAQKARKKLLKFFDPEQIKIQLPSKNDFGEMSKKEINEWALNAYE